MNKLAVLEGILFVVGDEGITLEKICEVLEIDEKEARKLAIISYNEPITSTGVDNLRGISSSFIIKKLMAKDLIKVCGKSDLPGHPNLYKTTREFLDYFGLASLSDLPEIKFNKENSNEEVDLYKSTYKEN